jgi:hypothetical protein
VLLVLLVLVLVLVLMLELELMLVLVLPPILQATLFTHHRPLSDHLPSGMPQPLNHISQAQLHIRVS